MRPQPDEKDEMNQRDQRQGHGIDGGPGRHRSARRWRAGIWAAVLAGASVLAAACGGSSGSAATTGHAGALAYAQCLRSHGVPGWPDPDSHGYFEINAPEMGINMNSATFASANKACAHLDPAFSSPWSSGKAQKFLAQALKYVACMRSHGVTGMPDPQVKRDGRVGLGIPNSIDLNSPPVVAALRACQPLQPKPSEGS
jgi:hypothetical protein